MRARVAFLLASPCALAAACGGGGGEQSPNTPSGTGAGDISMIAPFVNAADMGPTREAFSASASAPWGFPHDGIDFFPLHSLTSFQAVADGNVVELREWENNGNWQVNVGVSYNAAYQVEYIFEPFSSNQPDGDTQKANIAVSLGQHVTQRQPIGRLVTTSTSAHLHLGLLKNNTAICPDPYFTPDARQAILSLVQMAYPNANLCY